MSSSARLRMSRVAEAGRTARGSGRARIWAALGILYVVWGSTYLAIRVAIDTLPPMLMASTRFLVAGGALFAWSVRRGDRAGDRLGLAQWRSTAIVGGALLVMGNGGVVWAERRIPTGVVALIIATIPLWMAVIDRVVNGERLPGVSAAGLVIGFAGLGLLVAKGGGHIDPAGAAVAIVGAFGWAAGSVYSRRAPLPSRPLVGAGMEMLAGGVILAVIGVAGGELGRVHPSRISGGSVLALLYLVVVGSLLAYSAYVWLLRSAPLSLVSTYAYVNPVVAVFLGWLFLSEPVTGRTLLASAVILVSVVLIVTARSRPTPPPPTDGAPLDPGPCLPVAEP